MGDTVRMKKCSKCGKYTLKELCCGENTVTVKPPRFSPEDRYGRYRRILKRSLKK